MIHYSKSISGVNGLCRIILGIRGVGKTHLLQTIAHYLGCARSDLFVVFFSSEFVLSKSYTVLLFYFNH